MEFFNNHNRLFGTATFLFLLLTFFVAIMPALSNQENNAPLPFAEKMSEDAIKGKALYISNGCVACHSQQVRNVDMDKMWGKRPSISADYAGNTRVDWLRNTATLMGTERTGPDLTDVGNRQPSEAWNLVHLYNPRIVVELSIMPAYPWLFTSKTVVEEGDVVVNVPAAYTNGAKGKIVATEDAMYLVAYLQSLKQTPLPDGTPVPSFLYKPDAKEIAAYGGSAAPGLDGAMLYATHCQSCHQANGEGLPGAFPSLKGSKIVLDSNPELMVDIIMNGYSGRVSEGYPPMAAVGTNNELTPEEVTAIMNHERTSWGNDGRTVTVEEIKKLMEFVKLSAAQ
ncbi:cbb3-type cytochrome c oxidase subunit II [soil metagenome]